MRRFMIPGRPFSRLDPRPVKFLSNVGKELDGAFCTNLSAKSLMWSILPSSQLSVCLRPYSSIGGQSQELFPDWSGSDYIICSARIHDLTTAPEKGEGCMIPINLHPIISPEIKVDILHNPAAAASVKVFRSGFLAQSSQLDSRLVVSRLHLVQRRAVS